MSSHHIVREDQEPALILANWHELGETLLHELLEWSPTVVVPAEQAYELAARQTKIDIAIGRADPLSLQDTVRFIQTDEPFVDAVVRHLAASGYTAAYLASTDTPPARLLAYLPGMTVTLFSNGIRYYPVRSGFAKWKPAGELVYMESTAGVEYAGLAQIGPKEFRTTDDGFFTLSFPDEYLVIGEGFKTH